MFGFWDTPPLVWRLVATFVLFLGGAGGALTTRLLEKRESGSKIEVTG
jgi:hypothetical protein